MHKPPYPVCPFCWLTTTSQSSHPWSLSLPISRTGRRNCCPPSSSFWRWLQQSMEGLLATVWKSFLNHRKHGAFHGADHFTSHPISPLALSLLQTTSQETAGSLGLELYPTPQTRTTSPNNTHIRTKDIADSSKYQFSGCLVSFFLLAAKVAVGMCHYLASSAWLWANTGSPSARQCDLGNSTPRLLPLTPCEPQSFRLQMGDVKSPKPQDSAIMTSDTNIALTNRSGRWEHKFFKSILLAKD